MRPSFILFAIAIGCDAGTSNAPPDGSMTGDASDGSTASTLPPLDFDPGPNEGVTLSKIGDTGMRIVAPTVIEIWRIGTKAADPARVDAWDFVDENSGALSSNAPSANDFKTSAGAVKSIGFRRRPRYAPFATRDLRIGNSIYLVLDAPIADGADVTVSWNGQSWKARMDPVRSSPAIHVSQAGYGTHFAKKAAVGVYLGSLGELAIDAQAFTIVDARTGMTVHSGNLSARKDEGWTYAPSPYQNVLEADFTAFDVPGDYRMIVPGLGASVPFVIDDGVPAAFARTYALGLYHQRCGAEEGLPFTRFSRGKDHVAAARVIRPDDAANWSFIQGANGDWAQYQAQGTPRLVSAQTMLYPFVKSGLVDVSGGHHDAGDYSKYTTNSAALVSNLVFAADAFPGVAALDNLGLPESGDGIGDVLQEAKWEADFLAKLQDDDGGFFFIVYPRQRQYEQNVTPDHGDGQLLWPKNTAASAAATAALAQASSSPAMKKAFPAETAKWLGQARKGWQFLQNAIAKFGKDGAYQKMTHYGNTFGHTDEIAWAAAELFGATGEAQYSSALQSWMPDPNSASIRQWSWWRAFDAYGGALRACAFVEKTGRLPQGSIDAAYRQKCEAELVAAGDDQVTRANKSAYGTSFPLETKAVRAAGWYFSSDQAFDIAVAQQLAPKQEYLDAIVSNLGYEAGGNPVNVSFITGIGWKRQREIVFQWAASDRRTLPMTGIPLGNVQDGFMYGGPYGGELGKLGFPMDGATQAPYPFYDRWGDSFNVATELVSVQLGRALGTAAFLMAQTPLAKQAYKNGNARIDGVPSAVFLGDMVTATFAAPGEDLSKVRVVWDGQDIEPAFGGTFALAPSDYGPQRLEVEAMWPDGRRAFAIAPFEAHVKPRGKTMVSVAATKKDASETGPTPGEITFTRSDATGDLVVRYAITGGAAYNWDYDAIGGNYWNQLVNVVTIPAGKTNVAVAIKTFDDDWVEGDEDVVFTLIADDAYDIGDSTGRTSVVIHDDD